MVPLITPSPSPLFQIRLEENTLTMHGSQTESVGCVLRGQLVLALTEPTKFKEIRLTFQGKCRVSWPVGTYFHKEERIIYQHDWTFLPAAKSYHLLKPDNYHWDFELILPGSLPQTIEGCAHGSIKYKLKAVAERNAFAFNLKTQRQVTLLRGLSSLEFLQSSVISSIWTNKIAYEFSSDSKAVCLGEKIPIMIRLRSIQENLKVQRIICILKECATYTVGTSHKTESKALRVIEEANFSRDVNEWNKTIEIPVPDQPEDCLYDSEYNNIRVEHKVKFYVTFMDLNDRSHICELRATIPIIITSVSPDTILPAYHENNESNLDVEDYASTTHSSSSSTSSLLESIREVEELSKLPSYSSIQSCIPAPYSLLPPTYDASISSH